MSMLQARDVEQEIRRRWAEAHAERASYVDIRAGDVHHKLGGQNRVPQVCQVMRRLRDPQDLVSIQSKDPCNLNSRIGTDLESNSSGLHPRSALNPFKNNRPESVSDFSMQRS